MSDEGHSIKGQDEEGSGDDTTAFLAIGITFLSAALIMGMAQGNWTLTIPFLGVGLTFAILGLGKRGSRDASEGEEPDETDG